MNLNLSVFRSIQEARRAATQKTFLLFEGRLDLPFWRTPTSPDISPERRTLGSDPGAALCRGHEVLGHDDLRGRGFRGFALPPGDAGEALGGPRAEAQTSRGLLPLLSMFSLSFFWGGFPLSTPPVRVELLENGPNPTFSVFWGDLTGESLKGVSFFEGTYPFRSS